MSDHPTILFYEPNDFRFYGAAQVLLWLMQHMQAVRPVFVAPGDGVLTQRVRAAGIETIVVPLPAVWRRMDKVRGTTGRVGRALLSPVAASHSLDLARLMRRTGAQGIYANSTRAALYAGPAARAAGIPMWWALRRERPPGAGERLAYAFSDRVLCDAEAVRRRLGSPEKAITLLVGVPADRLDPTASKTVLRRTLGWPGDALVVGNVASLAPRKRHDVFIAMAERLVPQFPQARFLIRGDRAEGVPPSFEAQLRSRAQPLMEAGRLAILGWVESLSEVYAAMDVFCFPSDNEGFGLVAVEAMFMGLPVVRTDIAGGEDMIVEGENGFLVPAGNLDALTDRVARLLSNPALAAHMGAAGQRIAHEQFTAGRMAAATETLMLARVAQFTRGT